ncbi:MAG: dihydrofolate reductase [Flavobacteriaceae bacterium]|nr:dihydrofolate reductase [Flavobacteriaceae bacterium]
MIKSELTIIAAASTNNVIGLDNKLIWNIPKDLKRFKELTQGHSVIMGRKTFESLPSPLPNRRNIVVTRNKDYSPEGIEVFSSIEDALDVCREDLQPFIIGGGEIYSQTINLVDKIELTRVYKDYQGDAFFPDIPLDNFELANELVNYLDDDSSTKYSFLTYIRK